MSQELQKIGATLEKIDGTLLRVAASLEILSTRENKVLSGASSENQQTQQRQGFFSNELVQNLENKRDADYGTSEKLPGVFGTISSVAQSSISPITEPSTIAYNRSYQAEYTGPQQKLQGIADELSKSGVVKSEDEWRKYAEFYQRTEFAAWKSNTDAVSVVTSPMQNTTALGQDLGKELFEIVKVLKGYVDSAVGAIAK